MAGNCDSCGSPQLLGLTFDLSTAGSIFVHKALKNLHHVFRNGPRAQLPSAINCTSGELFDALPHAALIVKADTLTIALRRG